MVLCYPSTPKKKAMAVGCFAAGAALFAFGLHLSYVYIAPQQARIKARNDFVRDKLRKKYGKQGMGYHAININGSHGSPPVVIDRLRSTMKGLGC